MSSTTNSTSDVSGQLDNQEGIFINWSLALILGLPILLLLISLSVYICSQYPSSKSKKQDSKDRSSRYRRLLSSLKKGLRIETCPLDVLKYWKRRYNKTQSMIAAHQYHQEKTERYIQNLTLQNKI